MTMTRMWDDLTPEEKKNEYDNYVLDNANYGIPIMSFDEYCELWSGAYYEER